METNEKKTRIITLTGAPPVRIVESDWPRVAHGYGVEFDGEYQIQANRVLKYGIAVRQHEDGRAIVYGYYDYDSRWQGEKSHTYKAGYVVPAQPKGDEPLGVCDPVVSAIGKVAADLCNFGASEDLIDKAERECIADLPPVDL